MNLPAKITKTLPEGNSVRAIASLVIDDCFAVHGVKIIESSKGPFVSMPGKKFKDKFDEICHPINSETRKLVNETVLQAYEQMLANPEPERSPEKAPARHMRQTQGMAQG